MKLDLNLTALHIASQQEANGASNSAEDPQLAAPLEEYLAALQTGDRPDRAAFLAQYPDLADKLAPLLDGLEFVHQVAPQLRSGDTNSAAEHGCKSTAPASLGDYRIVREVGRGGMGVVYEAEQISLARRVALKVLPFAAVMDPRRLARFRNEAQAAATLTHQHIVPVYAVGSAQGVHYYAMQFIDGCTLADMIEQLRLAAGKTTSNSSASHSPAVKQLAQGLTVGRAVRTPGESPQASPPGAPQRSTPSVDTVRPAQAAISTENSHASAHYVRTITELAVRIAEALDYAHRQGVVHRDIKPGNLLLDMQGNPWITDFGLARIETETNLTMTGDLVGTLRYMSPEQALAQRVVVDHRTDIYSFGVTLYELLTLEPLFAAEGRQELLRDIAFREPTSLRKLQRSVPADLETIVMKSIAKNPAERYATAQEMADDLRRLLADQPIRARRPNILMRARKWSRRHRAVVTSVSAVSVCALLLGAGLVWRERNQTLASLVRETEQRLLAQENADEAQAQRKLAQAEAERAEANFQQAQQAVDQYLTTVSQSTLLDTPGMEPLRKELLQGAVQYYERFAREHAEDSMLHAELAAAHIRLAHLYSQTGSNQWIDELEQVINIVKPLVEQGADVSQWKSLREGVLFSEFRGFGDPQDQSRGIPLSENGIAVWEKLAKAHPAVAGFTCDLAGFQWIRATLLDPFKNANNRSEAATLFEQSIANWERFPDQVTGSSRQLMLAMTLRLLANVNDLQGDKEAQYQHAKKAIQVATSAGRLPALQTLFNDELLTAYKYLGFGAGALGRQEEATEAWRKLTEIEPRGAGNHEDRGRAFEELHEPDKALAEYSRAIELDPNNAGRYNERARIFEKQGTINRALADYSRAVELDPDNGWTLRDRAEFCLRQGLYQEGLADCKQILTLGKNFLVQAECIIGRIHTKTRELEAAEADFGRAVELAIKSGSVPELIVAYRWRAHFLVDFQSRFQEAIADCNKEIELAPTEGAFAFRGAVNFSCGDFRSAASDWTKALDLKPSASLYGDRASAHRYLGEYEKAVDDTNRATELAPYDWLQVRRNCGLLAEMRRFDQSLDAINAAIERMPDISRVWETRAKIYICLEKYDQSLADWNIAVERAKAKQAKIDLLFERGCLQRLMGNVSGAEADFRAVIDCLESYKADDAEYDADYLRAQAYAYLHLYEEALAHVGTGRNAFGQVVPHQMQLRADILFAQGHFKQAANELQQAIEDAPNQAVLHSLHGIALAELRHYENASNEFTRTLELAPNRSTDRCRRGWVAFMQGRENEALEDFEESGRRDEFNPLALRRLAWFLTTCPNKQCRDPARAVVLAEKAASIRPHEGTYWYTLGVCQYRRGDYEAARTACQRAADMRDLPYSPSNEWFPLNDSRVVTDYDRDAGFFLAMSQWQLGDRAKARETFDAAVVWTNEHASDDEQLKRFQAEANALIALPDHPGN